MINQIICGDCLEVMKEIPDNSIDMVLCDLPYGITKCKWDSIISLEPLWEQYKRLVKKNSAVVLTASQPFTSVLVMSNITMFKYEWIWEKTQATGHLDANRRPLRAHESVLVFYKKLPTYNPQKTVGHKPMNSGVRRPSNQNFCYNKINNVELPFGGNTDRYPRSVLIFSSDKQTNYLHPTQKPVALFEYLIKTYTNEGDVVLDNCIGSGTTAVAAMNTNRKFIGIEKEEKYCEIARNRLNLDSNSYLDRK